MYTQVWLPLWVVIATAVVVVGFVSREILKVFGVL